MVELEKLCVLHCSDREIADWFGVSLRTLERRRQEPEFAAVIDRGRSKGKISVRRMQMKLLEQGNTTMAIWLGNQLLGQSDYVEHEVHSQTNQVFQVLVLPKIRDGDPDREKLLRGLPGPVISGPDTDSV